MKIQYSLDAFQANTMDLDPRKRLKDKLKSMANVPSSRIKAKLGRLVLPGILRGDFMQIFLMKDLIYESTEQFVLIWGGYFVKIIKEPCIN